MARKTQLLDRGVGVGIAFCLGGWLWGLRLWGGWGGGGGGWGCGGVGPLVWSLGRFRVGFWGPGARVAGWGLLGVSAGCCRVADDLAAGGLVLVPGGALFPPFRLAWSGLGGGAGACAGASPGLLGRVLLPLAAPFSGRRRRPVVIRSWPFRAAASPSACRCPGRRMGVLALAFGLLGALSLGPLRGAFGPPVWAFSGPAPGGPPPLVRSASWAPASGRSPLGPRPPPSFPPRSGVVLLAPSPRPSPPGLLRARVGLGPPPPPLLAGRRALLALPRAFFACPRFSRGPSRAPAAVLGSSALGSCCVFVLVATRTAFTLARWTCSQAASGALSACNSPLSPGVDSRRLRSARSATGEAMRGDANVTKRLVREWPLLSAMFLLANSMWGCAPGVADARAL